MEFAALIARINELYHKSKSEGLTVEEQKEQAVLRRQYIDVIKGNVRAQLDQIKHAEDEHDCCVGECDCGKH